MEQNNSILNDIISDLQNDEGFRLQVYDDATGLSINPGHIVHGHPTIGYGRALDVKGISRDESIYLLRNDITELLKWCAGNLAFFSALSETRQRVVINMCFQMGEGGFLKFHELIGAIETCNWKAAHDAMLNSGWAKETPERALKYASWMLNNVVS